ncbi:metallophosphoesterase [Adhaeribacter rhizoryzae]|uniref:Serine/threonine protein phosphatase n=1 Tax=Adhaeribacter rhizoryzae TaxID=2607907 RepID=A0A5M6CZP6_9BACT|nr:metallophosphoesterase [Adhaeribacter rhizoryzae]KAA5540563.1 serine/threonine protein phosphatase [Adhaeribacter rhizoryzae]
MRRFVFSDSHGGYKAMVQCLERCGFNNDQDQLFFLGDVVDGWSQTKESIQLLLGIRNLVHLLGNHDQWAIKGFSDKSFKQDSEDQNEHYFWIMQGGDATVKSYGPSGEMPPEHLQFLLNAKPYHVTEDNILLVHAGFDPEKDIAETDTDWLIWSRDFINKCYQLYRKNKYRLQPEKDLVIPGYKEIYIGHTPTTNLNQNQTTPLKMGNLILMDTGAAFSGCLSIMDLDTKEVWQSNPVMTLYPDEGGRNGLSWNALRQA